MWGNCRIMMVSANAQAKPRRTGREMPLRVRPAGRGANRSQAAGLRARVITGMPDDSFMGDEYVARATSALLFGYGNELCNRG
jgi:hypothetical protein